MKLNRYFINKKFKKYYRSKFYNLLKWKHWYKFTEQGEYKLKYLKEKNNPEEIIKNRVSKKKKKFNIFINNVNIAKEMKFINKHTLIAIKNPYLLSKKEEYFIKFNKLKWNIKFLRNVNYILYNTFITIEGYTYWKNERKVYHIKRNLSDNNRGNNNKNTGSTCKGT